MFFLLCIKLVYVVCEKAQWGSGFFPFGDGDWEHEATVKDGLSVKFSTSYTLFSVLRF